MRNDRELIVIESLSGTKFSMLKPVIFYGTVLTLISLFFTINLSPKSNHNFRYLINDIKSKYSSSLLQEGVFNIIGEDFTIFVKQRHSDGKLKNIFIHDTREKGKPNTLISKQGTLIDSNNENKIFLEDGSQQFLSKEKSKLSILYFDKYLLSFSESSGSSLKEYGKPHQKDHYLSYQILIYQMVMISKINKLLKQNLFKDFPYLQIHYVSDS